MITPLAGNRLAWGFAVLAAALFVVRGPMRAVHSSGDFAAPYGATKAWMAGEDPYDARVLASILAEAGRERDTSGRPAFTVSLYPPPTFVVLMPLATLSWNSARLVWLGALLVLLVAHLGALLRASGLTFRETRGVLLGGGILALAPYHTGIALGQPAIASICLLVIAIDRILSDSEISGGLALALATVMKPQVAAPFILYYLLRGHRRAALVAIGTSGAIAGVAFGWLWLHQVEWYPTWTANRMAELNGGAIDARGPMSFHMVDLRPLLVALTDTRYPGAIALAVCTAVGAAVYRHGRYLSQQGELLLLSTVAILVLLVGYHRFYDAALLCVPLAWAVGKGWTEPRQRVMAGGVLAGCAVFFAPGAIMLQRMSSANIATSPSNSFWWNAIVLRHQNWTLILLQLLVLLALYRIAPQAAATATVTQQKAPTRTTR